MAKDSTQTAKILDDKEAAALFRDGLENLIANMGTDLDKRNHSTFVNKKRLSLDGNQDELNALYRTNWLAGKIVDIIPDDMTREWRAFKGDIEPDVIKALQCEEDRLALASNFNQAHKWARLYGTSVLVMSIDDGLEPDKPLDLNKVKPGSLKHIKPVDRHRFDHAQLITEENPLSSNYGMPKFYRFRGTSVTIHHSRVIRFDGVRLPFDEFRHNSYNSDSVLDRIYESITNFETVTQGSASMVYETNVDIVRVKGLMRYLESAEGEALLRRRFTLANLLKSFNNTMLLDTEEEYTNKTNTFAGLPDLLDRYAQILSAASDVPATRLLGTSASGLNATGEGDLKNYYDVIRARQNNEYRPKLNVFDKVMAKSLGIADGIDLDYEFVSLFQMTGKEKAELEFTNAQRDALYIDHDVIPISIVAKELQQNHTYANIGEDFIKELEEYENDGTDANSENLAIGNIPEAEEGEEEESPSSEESEDPRGEVQE